MPKAIKSLADVADLYDAFLIDQFGVLRDGRGSYPQAPEALIRLHALGKNIVILSNSGKRMEENSVRLAAIGFDAASWDLFLTSGETAWRIMQAEAGLNRRKCLLISRDDDLSPLNGLPIDHTQDADEADIVLIAASEGDRFELDHYRQLLAPAAARGVECLCTNPDQVMLTPSGTAYGAGRIADLYTELGGTVRFIGKPFADIYREAKRFLEGIPDNRICAIGDSIEHDIAGARGAGLDSILVTTGILETLDDKERQALFAEHNAAPTFILPAFSF